MLDTIARLEAAANEQAEVAMKYSNGKSAVARQMIGTVRELVKVSKDLRTAHGGIMAEVAKLKIELESIKGRWWYRLFGK